MASRKKTTEIRSPLPIDPPPEWKGLKRGDLWAYAIFRGIDLFGLATWFGGLSLIAFLLVGYPLSVTSGKHTSISVILQSVVSARLEFILSVSIAGISTFFWYRERKLHRQDIKRFSARIHELESHLHAKRLSSGLTETGDTPKKGLA